VVSLKCIFAYCIVESTVWRCVLKVVHPRVRRFLRGRGVLVLDRLGHHVAIQLARQCGAQPIAAPFAPICADQLGRLSVLSQLAINDRCYVCLEGGPRPVWTLVLCAVTEEAGEELKRVSNAAYRVLRRALREQVLIDGAGVWQQHLADHVRESGRQRAVELSDRFGCGTCDVENVSECLAASLDRLSRLMQPQSQRHQPGGMSSSRREVLDLMSSAVSGLKTATLIAQSLLKLQYLANGVP